MVLGIAESKWTRSEYNDQIEEPSTEIPTIIGLRCKFTSLVVVPSLLFLALLEFLYYFCVREYLPRSMIINPMFAREFYSGFRNQLSGNRYGSIDQRVEYVMIFREEKSVNTGI